MPRSQESLLPSVQVGILKMKDKTKTKTKLIEDNRNARMILDILYRKVINGEMDHIFSLIETNYQTEKINGNWETKEISKQTNIKELDKKIESSRSNAVESLNLVFEQLRNYNKVLNERQEKFEELKPRTIEESNKAEKRLIDHKQKEINQKNQFEIDCKNSADRYEKEQIEYKENEKRIHEEKIINDPNYKKRFELSLKYPDHYSNAYQSRMYDKEYKENKK